MGDPVLLIGLLEDGHGGGEVEGRGLSGTHRHGRYLWRVTIQAQDIWIQGAIVKDCLNDGV